jgi:PEP-CTERM motif
MKKLVVVLCLLVLSLGARAKADVIQTIGEYSGTGTFNDPGPYQPSTIVGTFTILPGDSAITISGTFGNSASNSSAGVNLFLGNILVAQCVEFAACYTSTTPFSDTLTAGQIASLGTGTVNFTAVETSQFVIRLGTTTLDQVPSTVPEPSTFALLGTGILGCVGAVRRKLSV